MQVLVSLHDVTPGHLSRLERAEALLTNAGAHRVAYLLVPDFHRTNPIAGNKLFGAWCAGRRPFQIDWVLHGYDHLEDRTHSTAYADGPVAWMKRALLTSGEGEFLTLPTADQRARLIWGIAAAESIGIAPDAFVAPAWLFNDALLPELSATGFRYTENHRYVIDVRTGVARSCPVITWATSTLARRAGSLVVCPALLRLWRRAPAIRIAVHPLDFDHPKTVDSIRRVLDAALAVRQCAGHEDLFR